MPKVVGIDVGTISVDLCGLDNGDVFETRSFPTSVAMASPSAILELLRSWGPLDLIVGPSGYGLPLTTAESLSDEAIQLAALPDCGEASEIPGFRALLRALRASGLPIVFTPGVIHLPTVPAHRKVNRVDMGTADKVCAVALAIQQEARRSHCLEEDVSLLLVEMGGAFSGVIAVHDGRIVDGVGGTSGPLGCHAAGALDGEVAFLAGTVGKRMLFGGGMEALGGLDSPLARAALIEGVAKAIAALSVSAPGVRLLVMSGRLSHDESIRDDVRRRLVTAMGTVTMRPLRGFTDRIKEGAQGAALLADGLAGGAASALVDALALREARGTVLDHLYVISPHAARTRLGLS